MFLTKSVFCQKQFAIFSAKAQRADMQRFIHEENLRHLRKLLSETTDAAEREKIIKLLAEEDAKDPFPQSQAR